MSPSTASASFLVSALLMGADAHAATGPLVAPNPPVPLFGKMRSEISQCSPWAERQFADLLNARESWHNYDADPIQLKTITQLKALMFSARSSGEHSGHIVPGADGSLQAEWHLDEMSVGALVEDDGSYSAWARFDDNGSQVEEYGFNSIDFLRSLAVAYRLDV